MYEIKNLTGKAEPFRRSGAKAASGGLRHEVAPRRGRLFIDPAIQELIGSFRSAMCVDEERGTSLLKERGLI